MSDTPPERDIQWTDKGVESSSKFIQRAYKLVCDGKDNISSIKDKPPSTYTEEAIQIRKATHKSIKYVTDALDNLRFNRAIAHIYELTNDIHKIFIENKKNNDNSSLYAKRECLETYCKLFSPMAPHLAEECWKILGHSDILSLVPWPRYQDDLIQEETIMIIVQVNGKKRGELLMPKKSDENVVKEKALELDNVNKSINKDIKKIIYVPDRILNVVI